jgi:hypothetical protein
MQTGGFIFLAIATLMATFMAKKNLVARVMYVLTMLGVIWAMYLFSCQINLADQFNKVNSVRTIMQLDPGIYLAQSVNKPYVTLVSAANTTNVSLVKDPPEGMIPGIAYRLTMTLVGRTNLLSIEPTEMPANLASIEVQKLGLCASYENLKDGHTYLCLSLSSQNTNDLATVMDSTDGEIRAVGPLPKDQFIPGNAYKAKVSTTNRGPMFSFGEVGVPANLISVKVRRPGSFAEIRELPVGEDLLCYRASEDTASFIDSKDLNNLYGVKSLSHNAYLPGFAYRLNVAKTGNTNIYSLNRIPMPQVFKDAGYHDPGP